MADMDDTTVNKDRRARVQRHRGRGEQTLIYFGKLARMFLYQSDWKVIPMSAIIAALVSLVVRNGFFATMEGTLKGAFALTCVAIWNGSFNSILVICRERNIIKREHRSGLHITAYVLSHMIFQLLLCLVQAGITIYVFSFMGVKFPEQGMMTQWMTVDIGITVFIISYASDMISLFVSSLVHSTTTAMTVMPFILIVQLVFSGGIFNLPAWSNVLSQFTISNYGLKCVAAQADYNSLPMDTAWKTLEKLSNNEISRSYTVGEIVDFLRDESNPTIMGFRESETDTRELVSVLVGEEYADMVSLMTDLDDKMTVGEVIDALADNPLLLEQRERTVEFNMTVGEIIDLIGRNEVKNMVQNGTAKVSQVQAYRHDPGLVTEYWLTMCGFALLFAVLAVISLEFIDKDKR